MTFFSRRRLLKSAGGLLATTAASTSMPWAHAQGDAYPRKPIRLVVGFPAGGSADAQARLIAAKLGGVLGQQVVVDNKPGAGGNIGADAVAKAAPDGYTLLLAAVSSFSINPWLYPKLPFDPAKDFAFVGQVAAFQGVVVIGLSQPFRSMKELASYAKANPGKVSYGTPGSGTTPHLASKLFEQVAGVQLLHVPYRGDATALTDTMGGQVPVAFVNLGPAVTLVQSGKVRALALTGNTRSAALPGVPTLEEAGFPNAAVPSWSGLVAPAGTPAAIVARLSQALKVVTDDADFREKAAQQTADVAYSTAAAFSHLADEDRARLGKVIKEAGITLD